LIQIYWLQIRKALDLSQHPENSHGKHGIFYMLVAGTSLGLLGAWLAVGRHLAAIEPM